MLIDVSDILICHDDRLEVSDKEQSSRTTVITGGVVNEINAMRTSQKRLDLENHGANDMDHRI